MIRLLQSFDKITLDMNAQPQRATSLLEWKSRRQEVERDLLTVHLSLSTKVSFVPNVCQFAPNALQTGWYMGEDE